MGDQERSQEQLSREIKSRVFTEYSHETPPSLVLLIFPSPNMSDGFLLGIIPRVRDRDVSRTL